MYVDSTTIITTAALITAMITIGGVALAIVKWVFRQQQQDKDIALMKEELCILTYGVLACLKGLQEQGCNGTVTETIHRINEFIIQKGHNQNTN